MLDFIQNQTNWYKTQNSLLKVKRFEMKIMQGQIFTVLLKTVCLRANVPAGADAFGQVDEGIDKMRGIIKEFEPQFKIAYK